MATAAELRKMVEQRDSLTAKIAELEKETKDQAITKAAQILAEAGLSIDDLIERYKHPPRKQAKRSKVAAKYVNKETGETWSGRGLQPKWLKQAVASGKKLKDFAV